MCLSVIHLYYAFILKFIFKESNKVVCWLYDPTFPEAV